MFIRIDEGGHFRVKGVIIVELIHLFTVGSRTADVEGRTVVRVDQLELVPIRDCVSASVYLSLDVKRMKR